MCAISAKNNRSFSHDIIGSVSPPKALVSTKLHFWHQRFRKEKGSRPESGFELDLFVGLYVHTARALAVN